MCKRIFQCPVAAGVMTALAVLGILSGVMLSVRTDFSLNSLSLTSNAWLVFWNGFLSGTAVIAAIALGSVHILFVPVIFTAVFSKGLFYGFSSGVLVKEYGLCGLFKATVGMGIYNFIFMIIMLLYSSLALTRSVECFLNRKNYAFRYRSAKSFLLYTLTALVLSAMLATAEGIIGASEFIL